MRTCSSFTSRLIPTLWNLWKDSPEQRNIGHWGTGDLEITLRNRDDLEKAMPLLAKSYEVS